MSAALIAAIEANTQAIDRLTAVWQRLARKAEAIEKNPDSTGVQAAGVELAKFHEQPAQQPTGGFSL